MKKFLALSALVFAFVVVLLSCGKNESLQIEISDQRTKTVLSVSNGATVSDALEEAEISLSKLDEVSPSLETVLLSGSKITIKRYKKINLVFDSKKTEYALTGATVGDLVKKAKLKLNKHLILNYDKDTYLSEIEDDVVAYFEKLLIVEHDGKTEKLYTSAKTVKDALAENEIELKKQDRISPKLSSKVEDSLKVTINRVEKKEISETVAIPFETQTKYSNTMLEGKSEITQAGKNGQKQCKYELTIVDGVEESRKLIDETVITPAAAQIVTYGTKPAPTTAPPSTTRGRYIVSREDNPDCDDSGHGYWYIVWSDGTTEYVDY